MGSIEEHQNGPVNQEGQGQKRQIAGKTWAVRLSVGAVFLLALTAVIWYQARGLEQRLLAAVQPHLLTDVQVGSVSITAWESWPNVEVDLGSVRIEDAVEEGQDFVELGTLGVVFAWYPLIFGRLEVAEVKAEGGYISVQRDKNGRENWKFWKADGGTDSGVEWSVESLVLRDVQLEGEWWSSGTSDPVVWSTHCQSVRLALNREGEQEWNIGGTVGLKAAELDASGERWLNVVDLNSDLDMRFGSGDVFVTLFNAVAKNEQGAVDFEAVLGNRGGFHLALLCEEADGAPLLSLVPSGLTEQMKDLPSLSGVADVEVLVGDGQAPSGWKGPEDGSWSKGWAVRVAPQSLALRWKGLPALFDGGSAVVFPLQDGWKLDLDQLLGHVAEGEFRCAGSWSSENGTDEVAMEGELVARPKGVLPWLGEAGALPSGLVLQPGGVLRAQFDLGGNRKTHQPWSWSHGTVGATLTDGGVLLDREGREWPMALGEVKVTASPLEWEVTVSDAAGWGVNGGIDIRQTAHSEEIEVSASIVNCEVKDLLAVASKFPSNEGSSARSVPRIQWSVELEELKWGAMKARSIEAEGTYDFERKKGGLSTLKAMAFHGGVQAKGAWDVESLKLQGSLVEVDVSSLLEGTEGLGQNTLLPSHVRGNAWAEGTLDHYFGKPSNLAWETDLNIRIEQGELLDFGLLQRIPETLKAEGKYRLISDAEDLSSRLKRVRFEPLAAQVSLSRGVFNLEPTEVISDAMNVGIAGWQRISGGMDYTLDFALRDLKSDQEEFGLTADDGLGHRFFLAIGGTLDDPEFGYDRSAHKTHRQEERRSALGRLRGLILGEEGDKKGSTGRSLETHGQDTVRDEKKVEGPSPLDLDDDDDDFSP